MRTMNIWTTRTFTCFTFRFRQIIHLEATETIKTVNAQYGYKPEHSRLREQVGAVAFFIQLKGAS